MDSNRERTVTFYEQFEQETGLKLHIKKEDEIGVYYEDDPKVLPKYIEWATDERFIAWMNGTYKPELPQQTSLFD